MYCIHKSIRRSELTHYLPHRDVKGAEIILRPRMGGHRVVARNGPTDLSTEMVKYGPAWRVLDDKLEQLYRRIGQASVASTRNIAR